MRGRNGRIRSSELSSAHKLSLKQAWPHPCHHPLNPGSAAEVLAGEGGFSRWPVGGCRCSPLQVFSGHLFRPPLVPACSRSSYSAWADDGSIAVPAAGASACPPTVSQDFCVALPFLDPGLSPQGSYSFSTIWFLMQTVYKNLRIPCRYSYE